MNKKIMSLLGLFTIAAADDQVVFDWGAVPSYSTYTLAPTLSPGSYSFGFATNNFYLFGELADTISYDLRTLDLYARMGLTSRLDVGIKYSSPRAGLLSFKYRLLDRPFASSLLLGFGYMKGTRTARPENLTYYCFDLYPNLLVTKSLGKNFGIYGGLKGIVSRYLEEDASDDWFVVNYGAGLGLYVGSRRFRFMVETDYFKTRSVYRSPAIDKTVDCITGQSGFGVEIEL